jgi:hypothetical protein
MATINVQDARGYSRKIITGLSARLISLEITVPITISDRSSRRPISHFLHFNQDWKYEDPEIVEPFHVHRVGNFPHSARSDEPNNASHRSTACREGASAKYPPESASAV